MSKAETQYCEDPIKPKAFTVCTKDINGNGDCGNKFNGCFWSRKTKEGMNDKQS